MSDSDVERAVAKAVHDERHRIGGHFLAMAQRRRDAFGEPDALSMILSMLADRISSGEGADEY